MAKMNARTPISANLPIEAAIALYDQAGAALQVESFMGAAKDSVIEDLCDGKSVGHQKFWLRDVLDSAIEENSAGEIHTLGEMFSGEIDAYALTQYRQRLVESFVDRNSKLIEDRAEELAEQAEEDAQLWKDEE